MHPLSTDIERLIQKVLSGSATIPERQRLAEWVAEDDTHRMEFESFEILWKNREQMPRDKDILDEGWRKITAGIRASQQRKIRSKKQRKVFWMICIAFVFLLSLALLLTEGKSMKRSMRFNKATLSEIIEALRGNYQVEIQVENSATLLCHLSISVYGKNNVETVMKAIAEDLNLKYRRIGPESYLIVGQGCAEVN